MDGQHRESGVVEVVETGGRVSAALDRRDIASGWCRHMLCWFVQADGRGTALKLLRWVDVELGGWDRENPTIVAAAVASRCFHHLVCGVMRTGWRDREGVVVRLDEHLQGRGAISATLNRAHSCWL
jgi:hypothetical protein